MISLVNAMPPVVERSTVGATCKYNHECIDGAYCDIATQTCQCLSTHVSLDNQCVKGMILVQLLLLFNNFTV